MEVTKNNQEMLFKNGFNYIKTHSKNKEVNIANIIICLSSKNISNEDAISLFWIAYSLAIQNKNDFEKIQVGTTKKIQEQLINNICDIFDHNEKE